MLLNNTLILKRLLQFYVTTFFIITGYKIFTIVSSNGVFDRDGYLLQFNDLLEKGVYVKILEGTSVFFNLVIFFVYQFLKDGDRSILLVNVLSSLLFCIVGFKFLNVYVLDKNVKKISKIILFCFVFENTRIVWSNNDIFLSGIAIYMFYSLLCLKSKFKYVIAGVAYGLMLATRSFSILFIPVLVLLFALEINKDKLYNKVFCFIASAVFVVFVLNFPSILSNGGLSFYDKNSELYKYINFLAALYKNDHGIVSYFKPAIAHSDMSWSWERIHELMSMYNVKEVPKNLVDWIVDYPYLYFKNLMLNVNYTFQYLFRRYGFLFLFPFFMIKEIKDLFKKENFPFVIFLIMLGSLMLILTTILEFRWFATFEFFLFLGIVISFERLVIRYKEVIIMFSFIALGLMNLRTIINLWF